MLTVLGQQCFIDPLKRADLIELVTMQKALLPIKIGDNSSLEDLKEALNA